MSYGPEWIPGALVALIVLPVVPPLAMPIGDELLDREVADLMAPGSIAISEDATVADAEEHGRGPG